MGVIIGPSSNLLCLVCPGKEGSRQQQKPCHHQQDGVLQEREATTATSLSCKQGHGLLKQLQGRKGLEKNRTTADELREGEKWQFRETPQLNWNHYIWIRAHVHNNTVASWVKGRTNVLRCCRFVMSDSEPFNGR